MPWPPAPKGANTKVTSAKGHLCVPLTLVGVQLTLVGVQTPKPPPERAGSSQRGSKRLSERDNYI
eukprot:442631-Heterocapsa_arctica.AAC.1